MERLLAIVRAEVEASEPAALTAIVRRVVDDERARLAAGADPAAGAELADAVIARLEDLGDPGLTIPPLVINATGVILHTNLGRAPWPRAARLAAIAAASAYGYLELDEVSGRRGPRFAAAEEHLVALTGAEAALVVTNNAAALLLAVGLAGRRGSIVVSRGELVEIGGGVRIPEIVARAGARLVEVGTTNRTRPGDFEAALAEGRASAVLRVHPSNFAMSGFTESADLAEVAAIAHRHGALVLDDLGSGALLDTTAFGLEHEPTPAERLAAGADVVLFSGDKLVGGPQAGLIVGRRDLVARMRRDPLARAVRPDKAILAGVAATLAIYRAGRAALDIPVWRTIALDPAQPPGARRVDPGAPAVRSPTAPTPAWWSSGRRWAAARCPARRCPRSGSRCRPPRLRARRRSCGRARTGSWRGWRTARSCSTCGRCPGSTTGRSRAGSGTSPGPGHEQAAVEPGARMTVVVGTAGHIDHGKTTLLRALTGIDADRLPEERRRGMTIDVGYAHLALPDGSVLDFVDVPGHDRLVGNMLVGAGEIDAALLVVAADDGPNAQTIEHLELLDAIGIVDGPGGGDEDGRGRSRPGRRGVGRGRLLLVARTRLAGAPVVAVSGVTGAGLEELRTELVALRDRVEARLAPGLSGGSRLAIDRSFAVKGRGSVVTGSLRGGAVAMGAMLRLVPGGGEVRVREVQVQGGRRPGVRGGPDRAAGGGRRPRGPGARPCPDDGRRCRGDVAGPGGDVASGRAGAPGFRRGAPGSRRGRRWPAAEGRRAGRARRSRAAPLPRRHGAGRRARHPWPP